MGTTSTSSSAITSISPLLSGRFLYHDYGSDVVGKTLLEWRQQLRKKQDQYPGWKFWMSEMVLHGLPWRPTALPAAGATSP